MSILNATGSTTSGSTNILCNFAIFLILTNIVIFTCHRVCLDVNVDPKIVVKYCIVEFGPSCKLFTPSSMKFEHMYSTCHLLSRPSIGHFNYSLFGTQRPIIWRRVWLFILFVVQCMLHNIVPHSQILVSIQGVNQLPIFRWFGSIH